MASSSAPAADRKAGPYAWYVLIILFLVLGTAAQADLRPDRRNGAPPHARLRPGGRG